MSEIPFQDEYLKPKMDSKQQVDYTYALLTNIMLVDKALADGEEKRSEQLILSWYDKIPNDWRDDKFDEEAKGAFITKQIDIRPKAYGKKPSFEVCEALGLSTYREEPSVDVRKLRFALVNLMSRNNMLMKKGTLERILKDGLDEDRIQ